MDPERGNVPEDECGNDMLDLVERMAAQPVETAEPIAPGAAWRKEDEPLVGKAMPSGSFDR